MAKNDKAPEPVAEGTVALAEPTVESQQPEPAGATVGELYRALKPERWQHECAAALHGWKQHLHHAGEMRLSAENYQAAIDAALKGSGDVPHQPALSPHRGKGI